jgi:hypothetical protein
VLFAFWGFTLVTFISYYLYRRFSKGAPEVRTLFNYETFIINIIVIFCLGDIMLYQAKTRSRSESLTRDTELSMRTSSMKSINSSDNMKKSLIEGMLCVPLLGGML